jgi:hypothetical protein
MKRITMLAAAGALVASPALGAWAAFAAGDDAPSLANVRVDDRGRHGLDAEPGDDRGQDRRHEAHGPVGLVRHTGERVLGDDHSRVGNDDPAGHLRHSGDLEGGDDHGGNAGPGDDSDDDSGDDSGDDSAGDSGTVRDDSGRDDSGRDSGSGRDDRGRDDGEHHGGDDD